MISVYLLLDFSPIYNKEWAERRNGALAHGHDAQKR